MNRCLTHLLTTTALAIAPLAAPAAPEAGAPAAPAVSAKPRIQIAILLDTSSSMSGLINQARAHLWKVVNEFATATRDGQRPELEVALYQYGNDGLAAATGYIQRLLPLTTDLDQVSEKLFALTTNGGQEYCGWVIKNATAELAWSANNRDLKAIFIAGNEPFTQGPVPYAESCKAAIAKGILVNTIHCGGQSEGVNGRWQDGAVLADGTFIAINQNQAIAQVAAPQDKRIAALNHELNATYVAYGTAGRELQARQLAQDTNAVKMSPSAAAERAAAKSSAHYTNTGWDLVDAVNQKQLKLAEVKDAELPENMQKMSAAERETYVKEQQTRRDNVRQELQTLSAERAKFVAAESAKTTAAAPALDQAMLDSLRTQAKARDFKF